MFGYFVGPGSLRLVVLSPPSRYSIGSALAPNPEQSVKPAWVIPLISTRKLKLRYGSTRFPVAIVASARSARSGRRDLGELRDPEDHELGGLDRGHPDLGDHLPDLAGLGRVRGRVALHVERLLGDDAEQRPVAPHPRQQARDASDDLRPERRAVRLEHRELGALVDRLAQEDQQPP